MEVKDDIKIEESPHLTNEEIGQFENVSKLERMYKTRNEWNSFLKSSKKPSKENHPMMSGENGKVVRSMFPKEAPISKGNPTKGTLRNKKCSCGSGKKYKNCCYYKFY
jgi:uncharacterized protein YecA (UPF0149 family)